MGFVLQKINIKISHYIHFLLVLVNDDNIQFISILNSFRVLPGGRYTQPSINFEFSNFTSINRLSRLSFITSLAQNINTLENGQRCL